MTAATLTLTERTAVVTMRFAPDHFAERLRVRKGQTLWVTCQLGQDIEWRVTRVSMPDADGNVEVHVTAA